MLSLNNDEGDVIKQVLNYLDDYILDTNNETVDYNKKISEETIFNFYNSTVNEVISYLNLTSLPTDPIVLTFVYMWTAGNIWRKYNIRVNDQLDENYPIGYGDQLIISAKASLKPYRKYRLTAWG